MSILPQSSTLPGFSNFKYEPLDLSSKRPSIRLAILQPGIGTSTVRVTLAQAAFADRPRYEALSYTWGSQNELKDIELDNIRVDVTENLWVALFNLRDPQEPRTLWVDAICIDQSNMTERNHQVKLMAHIFSRAKEVLVWLGVLKDWKPSTRMSLNGRVMGMEIDELCAKPYWKRVWIVQEIGAATELRVHWALSPSGRNRCAPWEQFIEALRQSAENVDMALKLADQREGRHGDSFLLANLIEACQDSLCEETRDKVYGFIGIAHDCQDDSLPVDYSKSLFEVYEDVIRHEYYWAKENPDMLVKSKIMIMHLSQLIQKVLGGLAKMRQDFQITHPGKTAIFPISPVEDVQLNFDPFNLRSINSGPISISATTPYSTEFFDVFKVTGINSGSVSVVGPAVSEIVGDPNTSKKWKTTLSSCKMDLSILRRKNEGFLRTLLELNAQDLEEVCSIGTGFWWRRDPGPNRTQGYLDTFNKLPRFKLACDFLPRSTGEFPRVEESVDGPRLFLTRQGLMGLMPPSVRSGDMVFQFWNCSTVAFVRRQGDYSGIVGRGVVANQMYMEDSKFEIPLHDGFSGDAGQDIFVDMSTLQLLTQ